MGFVESAYVSQKSCERMALFWIFKLTLPLQTIIFTWISNQNNHSALSAALFHFMINYVGELFAPTVRAEIILLFFWMASGIAIVIFEGPRILMHESQR